MAGARGKGALIYFADHFISVGDKKHVYQVCALSATDKLVTWLTQISYSLYVIQYQIAIKQDVTESCKLEDIIDEAEEGLITCRKLYPDAIAFITKTDSNKI